MSSEWKLQGEVVTLKVTVPVNTEADIFLPPQASKVTCDGEAKQDVKFLVGSGDYVFTFELEDVNQKLFTSESVLVS